MDTGWERSSIVGSRSLPTRSALLGRTGAFWHDDYFDRYMRDEDHLIRTVRYVEQNPVKAGLVDTDSDWNWSSSRFRR